MEQFEQVQENLMGLIDSMGRTLVVSGKEVCELLDVPITVVDSTTEAQLDAEQIDYVANKITDYSDQVMKCVRKLAVDRTSRQAVVQFDTTGALPNCMVSISFQVRDDKLLTNVFQRSMDVEKKFAQDFEIARRMGEWICEEIDCELGPINFFVTNAHFYTQ